MNQQKLSDWSVSLPYLPHHQHHVPAISHRFTALFSPFPRCYTVIAGEPGVVGIKMEVNERTITHNIRIVQLE